jgi:holo-[acyl-carrier protein] synthase
MIHGIGVDIVLKRRVKNILQLFPNKFPDRILTNKELHIFFTLADNKKVSYLAKKFASKEAVAKALGTGIGLTISFKDIAILNHTNGKPYVTLENNKKNLIGNNKIDISISDEIDNAIAFVIISS